MFAKAVGTISTLRCRPCRYRLSANGSVDAMARAVGVVVVMVRRGGGRVVASRGCAVMAGGVTTAGKG